MQKTLTADDYIAKFIELRDLIALKTQAFEDGIKQHRSDMALLEGLLMDEINRLNGQAIKTAHGTAYRSTVTSYRVADRQVWFDWVFDNNQREMLTANVAKDAVKEYCEDHQTTPPGLDQTVVHKLNVRKADT